MSESGGSKAELLLSRAQQGGSEAHSAPTKEWQIRNSPAWFLCTAKFDEVRDGHLALEMATKACELTDYRVATCVNTLAAAYAEVGDFDSAVNWSEKTIELTTDDARREKFTQRLESYRSRKPWRG